ncbi:MAG: phosphonate metabolism protein/1,5-bisphosphokinase (PRPP-forming) PhnN [Rhodospirillaceae bacterium]|nr:phosphonate metabolism protein/1,5-bisphosphokinase (PRPP-forming) PhnN [Rhodospirillaceae bacterium]
MSAGRLVYVMGPSGAGKDSVLRHARRALDGAVPVAFAHRYITRPVGEDIENYIALTPGEFALRRARNLFAFVWEAYGFQYGVGIEIEAWRRAGLVVVVDGSRAHFVGAALGDVLPVLVTAPVPELRRRLLARGREDAAEIERRVVRAAAFVPAHPALVTIDNAGPVEQAGDALAALLKRIAGAA